jgi:hypothetical protein
MIKWKSDFKVTLWVNVLHYILEVLDYNIICSISGWLSHTRITLIDQHCNCKQCKGRYKK